MMRRVTVARQRHVYTTKKVIELWAAGRQDAWSPARPYSTVSTRDGVLYSYSVPIAHRLQLPTGVLFVINAHKYSVTTSKHAHIASVLAARVGGQPALYGDLADLAPPTFVSIEAHLAREIGALVVREHRARANKQCRTHQLDRLQTMYDQLCRAFVQPVKDYVEMARQLCRIGIDQHKRTQKALARLRRSDRRKAVREVRKEMNTTSAELHLRVLRKVRFIGNAPEPEDA